MLNESANNDMAKINLEPGDRFTSKAPMPKPAVDRLSDETSELSDRLSKEIAGGQSSYELSDDLLEAVISKSRTVVRVIGFEN
jgi:hypothetical protein